MSNPHHSNYASPNIVIVPTVSFCGPPEKKQKPNAESSPATQAMTTGPIANNNPYTSEFPIGSITYYEPPATQELLVNPAANSRPCMPVFPVENFTNFGPPVIPVPNSHYPCVPVFPMQNISNFEPPATQILPAIPEANFHCPCMPMFPMENISNPGSQLMPPVIPMVPECTNCPYVTTYPMENNDSAISIPIENKVNNVPIQVKIPVLSAAGDASKKYSEEIERRAKKTLSWASSYLQSIGQSQPKVAKLKNLAQLKLFPKVEEGSQHNATKNLFKPTFKCIDTDQSCPNSLTQSSNTNSLRKIAPIRFNLGSAEKNNSHDSKEHIKINLLHTKHNTDTNEESIQNNINRTNTTCFLKHNIEEKVDCKPTHSNPKSIKNNTIESKKYTSDSKTQYFEKVITDKKIYYVSTSAHSKLSDRNNMNKIKHDKNFKNTKLKSTSNIKIPVKKCTDIGKDKNKQPRPSKLLDITQNVNKLSSDTRYKTKETSTSGKTKRHSENPLHSHGRKEFEAWAFNRIKTHSVKPTHSHNKSYNLKRETSDAEMVSLKSKKSTYKDKGNYDHKNKSQESTKCKDNNESKNISKSSEKSNVNNINKTSAIPHATPIKSVVQVPNHYDLDSSFKTLPDNTHNVEDLRIKLKRKYQHTQNAKRDNLVITLPNDNDKEDEEKKSAADEKQKPEKKTKKYKKIKLVINVICEKCSESSESDSDINNNEEYTLPNVDLSFLDDFNVDDIVESLNEQEDKVNVNTTNDPKNNITEKLANKTIIKNENKDILECNLQKRLISESPERKNNLNEQVDIFCTKDDLLQTSRNILSQVQNKNEKTDIEEDLSAIVVPETVNNQIICPVTLDTNQYNDRNNQFDLGVPSEVCETQLNHNPDDQLEKDFISQNNTEVDELINSKIHEEINIDNINTKNQTRTSDVAKDDIIIDLTQTGTDMTEAANTSSKKGIVNTQVIKQAADEKIKAIIDLTVSTEISELETQNWQTKDTSAQQQVNIKQTTPTKHIKVQSSVNIAKITNNTKEGKHNNKRKIPQQQQHNPTNVTGTKNEIIDLTIPTNQATDINNGAIIDITRPLKEQQNAAEENFTNANTFPQSSNMERNIKVTPAKVIIDGQEGNSSHDTDMKNIVKERSIGRNMPSDKLSEKATELQRQEISKITSNKADMENINKESLVSNCIMNGQTGETVPKLHESKSINTQINNDTETVAIGNATNVLSTEIVSRQHEISHSNFLNNSEIIGIESPVTKTVPELHQHKANAYSQNMTDTKNNTKTMDNIIHVQTTGFQQHEISEPSLPNAKTAIIPQETLKNDMNTESAEMVKEPLEYSTNETSLINEESTKTVLETPHNIIKMAYHIASQKFCGNHKPSNKQDTTATTQAETLKDTNLNDGCDDVLVLSISDDEKIISCDSDKVANSPTSSVKNIGKSDTKEAATTNKTKSIPESKAAETKTDDKSCNESKEKSDPPAIVKFRWKNEQLLALETRMLEYFGKEYSIESLINQGKFSKIYLCKDENGRNYALKMLNKGKRITGCKTEDMLKELQKDIPRQNYHIVYLVDGFALLDNWCFLMDYYPKNMQEVLYDNRKCFHIDVVQILARQLVSAVLILRNNNIMHLDIKPSHILMNTTNDRLKLAGFDESRYLEGLSVLPCVGTVNYRPPEVILGFPYFGKIDVWSTALVIYEMCTACQLFPGQYNNDILYKQMCTLGPIPFEMVIQSVFASKHYRGGSYFARRFGPYGQQCTLIDRFKKNSRLPTSLFNAYYRDWGSFRTRRQKEEDCTKLRHLRDLLQDMLILDPTRRIPIEFVYVNSFIYETYDSCV